MKHYDASRGVAVTISGAADLLLVSRVEYHDHRDSADVLVQGNEVLIGGHRLVLQLARRPK